MREKEAFCLFPRKLPSGKTVFYYRCYNLQGKRMAARSTGHTLKTKAFAFCMELYRQGLLVPEARCPTFAEYAEGWWDPQTCQYLQDRQQRNPLSEGTISIHAHMLRVHLIDFFGSYRLTDIDTNLIKAWFREMQQKKQFEGSKYEKPLNPKTINMAYRTLITMMEEAVDRKLITSNPTRKVSKLSTTDIDRVILNINEVRALFPANWNDIWDNWYTYKANRIAACTGMRIGELRGIRGIDVHSDYVCVHGQFTKFGYKDSTKNKHNRNVPINDELYQEFQELISVNHNGFLFSEDGGIEPIEAKKIEDAHNRALNKIGIDEVERKRRGLTFHAWRHFFNTLLKMADLADSKVMSVIGHLDKKSSEHYTHFDTTQFTEVRNAQTRLLSGPTPETPETESKKRGRPRKEKRAETGKPGRNEKQVKKPVKAAKADKTVKPSQAKKTAASRKTAKAAKAKKK